MPQVEIDSVQVSFMQKKSILGHLRQGFWAMVDQTTKNGRKLDPLGQIPKNGGKSLSENELHRGYGGEKASRRDLRGFIKTIWAFNEKVDELVAALDRLSAMLYTAGVERDDKLTEAMNRLSEKIDELINIR